MRIFAIVAAVAALTFTAAPAFADAPAPPAACPAGSSVIGTTPDGHPICSAPDPTADPGTAFNELVGAVGSHAVGLAILSGLMLVVFGIRVVWAKARTTVGGWICNFVLAALGGLVAALAAKQSLSIALVAAVLVGAGKTAIAAAGGWELIKDALGLGSPPSSTPPPAKTVAAVTLTAFLVACVAMVGCGPVGKQVETDTAACAKAEVSSAAADVMATVEQDLIAGAQNWRSQISDLALVHGADVIICAVQAAVVDLRSKAGSKAGGASSPEIQGAQRGEAWLAGNGS